MSKQKNSYSKEDFLIDTNKLLEDIEDADSYLNDTTTDFSGTHGIELKKNLVESYDNNFAFKTNGYVEITVSENEMQAIADFFPPSEGMEPLKPNDISTVLEEKQITEGVNWVKISEELFNCNTQSEPATNIIIAQGSEPTDEIPKHLEINKELLYKKREKNKESKKINYKQKSPFIMVSTGDILANVIPHKSGKMGLKVTGNPIQYSTRKVPQYKPGKNTQINGETVVASCDGKFSHDKSSFWVSEVLEIAQNIDYSTGHIDFPGDVIVYGEIQDGFKVNAGGAIYCAKTMDVSEIICEGEVEAKQGIIGRKKGYLKAGGEVRAKFIENCYVEAGESIKIEVGILNSTVHTSDEVKLGYKGIIIGGKVYAENGVTAVQLGSKSGTRTEVYCGIDYSVEQKLEWIRDKNMLLVEKLNRVKGEIKREVSNMYQLVELRDKLQSAIHKLNESANKLIYQLDKNEEVEIIIRGIVYPGVYIEICHCSYIVNRKLERVRFRLNKAEGKVVVESLY